jgi:hypothetical protein
MSLFAIINNALADAASQMTTQVLHEAVGRLADKYGFDFAEAIHFINLEPARPEVLKKKDMPWCGVVDRSWCCAIVSHGGLYTQCPKSHVTDGLCGTCLKQKQQTGSLKYGDVDARIASIPLEFLGKKVAPFSKIMEKNGWSQELVDRSAAEYGLTIPMENFVPAKPKRGRKVTRPVMETPEPVVPPIAVSSYVDEVSHELPQSPPLSEFVTYNASSDSDDEYDPTPPGADNELEEEVPVPAVKSKKSRVKAESDSKKPRGRPASPKTEGEVKPKKPRGRPASPKTEGEVKKKPRKVKTESGGESASESEAESVKTEVVPETPQVKKTADYSKITAVEAAQIKPTALRTACAQHGIDIGSKEVHTLRAELIAKVTQ